MRMQDRIHARLTEVFAPAELQVVNESDQHHGHHGSPGTGESHFRVRVVSERFRGLGRVARHRLVNQALAAELQGGVHALAIEAEAPGS
jgi:BolA protein